MFQPEQESWRRFKYSFVPSAPALLIWAVSQHPLLNHCNHSQNEPCNASHSPWMFPSSLLGRGRNQDWRKRITDTAQALTQQWHPLKLCRLNQHVPPKECLHAEKPSRAPSNTGTSVRYVYLFCVYSIYSKWIALEYPQLINHKNLSTRTYPTYPQELSLWKKGDLAFQSSTLCFRLKCLGKRECASTSATDQLWKWTGSLLSEQHGTNLACSEAKKLVNLQGKTILLQNHIAMQHSFLCLFNLNVNAGCYNLAL